MDNLPTKFKIGDAVEVKGKVYLVVQIQQHRVLCRQFQFSNQGQFEHYQDYNFPLDICQSVKFKDRQQIERQRIKASIQGKPYSAIRFNYIKHPIC